jgi:hypothetical protein
MIVKYKTVLKGDKAIEDAKGKGVIISPDSVERYSIAQDTHGNYAIEYCCEDMINFIKQNNIDGPIFSRDAWNPIPMFSINCIYPDDTFGLELSFCPFCGDYIKYVEVARTKLVAVEKKMIKYTDYIEEPV